MWTAVEESPGGVAGLKLQVEPRWDRVRELRAPCAKGRRARGSGHGDTARAEASPRCGCEGITAQGVPLLGSAPRRHRVLLFLRYPGASCAGVALGVRLPEPRERAHGGVSFTTPPMSIAAVAL